jgi:hypothetical protein
MLAYKGEITKSSGLENFQMSLLDLNNLGREALKNIFLAGLRILLVMIILVGVSFAIQECDTLLALDTKIKEACFLSTFFLSYLFSNSVDSPMKL